MPLVPLVVFWFRHCGNSALLTAVVARRQQNNNKPLPMQQQNDNKKIFSDRLKELRGSRSQSGFAELLGISSQQTYANYEKGRIPKAPILQQIAQHCGVSVDYLLGREPINLMETPTLYEVRRDSTLALSRSKSVIAMEETAAEVRNVMESVEQCILTAVINDDPLRTSMIASAREQIDVFATWLDKYRKDLNSRTSAKPKP